MSVSSFEHTKIYVVARHNSRGGRSAAEHLVAALRCLYRHAEDDGLIDPADNPARKVAKPRRLPSIRQAVPDDRLAEIHHAAATTGDDPALDTLLLRAARRDRLPPRRRPRPAPAGSRSHLVPDLPAGEGQHVRSQAVSPTLATHLRQHADEQGPGGDGGTSRASHGRTEGVLTESRGTYGMTTHGLDPAGDYDVIGPGQHALRREGAACWPDPHCRSIVVAGRGRARGSRHRAPRCARRSPPAPLPALHSP